MESFLSTLFGDAITEDRRVSIFSCPNRHTLHCSALSAAEAQARGQMATQDVYFGVGLINGMPSGRGKASDVVAIPGLWCDLDVAAGYRKNTALPAHLDEVRTLLGKMPLAPTILVDSGHGVHAYWLFKEPWIFESEDQRLQAAALAKGWHRLICEYAREFGWQVENLGDLARVLRLPGTINHKDPDHKAEVSIIEEHLDRRYNASDFEPYVDMQPELCPLPETQAAFSTVALAPDAEPPAEKFEQASQESPQFLKTWERKRDDLADQSQSAYDLSLATNAALREWTDQEIANLIIAARRKHQHKPEKALRPDYIERTIQAARKAAQPRLKDSGVDLSAFLPAPLPPDGPVPLGELVDACPGLRRPIIYGLLREGETMNVISAPKIGKSWLVNDLALSVATGRPWLGLETVQGDVLIIDNELHRETSADRLPKVAAARGIALSEISRRIYVENLRGRLQDLIKLGPYFRQFDPGRFKLVILDAFYRFLPIQADENDNGTMANLYNCIDRFADQLRCAFVLIHHTSKGNQSAKDITDVGAGAGAQSRATDTHCVLRHHEEKGAVVLEAAVRSWPPLEPRVLRWEFPVFHPANDLDPTCLRKETGRGDRKKNCDGEEAIKWNMGSFVEAFINPEPISKARIMEDAEAAGLSTRRALRFLDMAEEESLIHRWSIGKGKIQAYASAPAPVDESQKQKRSEVESALESNFDLSAAKIAEQCGVSVRYVQKLRREHANKVANN